MMTESDAATVGRYMHRHLEVLPEQATILAAAERMSARAIGSILVESATAQGAPRIAGIVTETDLVHQVLTKELAPDRVTVAKVMAKPLWSIASDRPMLDASHLMETGRIRHLCVSEGGEIVGLISIRDLVRHFVDQESGPVHDLEDVYKPLSVLMQRTMVMTESKETVLAAAQQMAQKHIGALFVREADEVVGIVTKSDFVRKVLTARLDPRSVPVRSVMNSPILSIDINRTIRDASELMAAQKVRHLAVMESHKIVGIVSVRDLVKMVSVRDRPRFLGKT